MVGTSKILTVIACCIVLLVGAVAHASILSTNPFAYNDGNGPAGGAWSGSSPFANGDLTGTVDWAVFTAATFDLLFGGGGYTAPPGELIYAHQIFTTGTLVGASGMSIALSGNPAGNGGSFSAGGVSGVAAASAFADSTIADYELVDETDLATPSEGLVYSSPNRPQLTGTPIVIDGGVSASGTSPIGIPGSSQVPEPTSCFIWAMIVMVVGVRRVECGD